MKQKDKLHLLNRMLHLLLLLGRRFNEACYKTRSTSSKGSEFLKLECIETFSEDISKLV